MERGILLWLQQFKDQSCPIREMTEILTYPSDLQEHLRRASDEARIEAVWTICKNLHKKGKFFSDTSTPIKITSP